MTSDMILKNLENRSSVYVNKSKKMFCVTFSAPEVYACSFSPLKAISSWNINPKLALAISRDILLICVDYLALYSTETNLSYVCLIFTMGIVIGARMV